MQMKRRDFKTQTWGTNADAWTFTVRCAHGRSRDCFFGVLQASTVELNVNAVYSSTSAVAPSPGWIGLPHVPEPLQFLATWPRTCLVCCPWTRKAPGAVDLHVATRTPCPRDERESLTLTTPCGSCVQYSSMNLQATSAIVCSLQQVVNPSDTRKSVSTTDQLAWSHSLHPSESCIDGSKRWHTSPTKRMCARMEPGVKDPS